MRFGIVLILLRAMVGCVGISGVRYPTKQLFVIKLFDNPCDLQKSVMRNCLVDVLSICGKTVHSVWALCPSVTGLTVDLGI